MKRLIFLVLFSLICSYGMAVGQLTGILTQEMLNTAGDVFLVRGDCTLAGATVTVPEGKTLVFTGGSIDGGEIVGKGTSVQMLQMRPAFGLNLVISGTWNVPEVHDGWFAFDDSKEFVSNQIIKNILALSNDETPCHIYFEEDRTYYFCLPYNGRGDFGKMVSTSVVDGKTKRNYSDILYDKFDFLRIFTIPSNTHLTVNNTLKMIPTSIGAYFVFWEYGKKSITIDGGGTISGENDGHLYEKPVMSTDYFGEWGHLFRCVCCHDFVFRDITLSDSYGDCIIYSGSYNPDEKKTRWASNLTIERVKILRARRNGIAVGARNVKISDCYFEGCGTDAVKGTLPRCAIDFEPDEVASFPTIGNQNVVMENCTFKDNYYDIASSVNNLPGYGKVATTIRNCRLSSGIRIRATYWMKFENCYIPSLYKKPDNTPYSSRYIEFENCEFGEGKEAVEFHFSKSSTNKFTNCKFNSKKTK